MRVCLPSWLNRRACFLFFTLLKNEEQDYENKRFNEKKSVFLKDLDPATGLPQVWIISTQWDYNFTNKYGRISSTVDPSFQDINTLLII